MQTSEPPRVMVVGGTGFIGAHAVQRAAEAGATVASLARGTAGPPGSAAHFPVDVGDRRAFEAALMAYRPDRLVFALSAFTPRSEPTTDAAALALELDALEPVLALARGGGLRSLVYLSSAGTIYGDGPALASESTPPSPKSKYGRMKLEGERRIAAALHGSQCRWAALRVSNPYGPGQDPDGAQGVVAIFIGRLLRGWPCEVIPGSVRDYLYVDDLGRAISRALDAPGDQVLNIASGRSLDAADLLRIIVDRLGATQAKPRLGAAGAHEVAAVRLDVSKAQARLGWRAEVELEDGLDRTIGWVRGRLAAGGVGPGPA